MKMKERFCELTAREIAIAEAVLSVLKAEPLQCGEAATHGAVLQQALKDQHLGYEKSGPLKS